MYNPFEYLWNNRIEIITDMQSGFLPEDGDWFCPLYKELRKRLIENIKKAWEEAKVRWEWILWILDTDGGDIVPELTELWGNYPYMAMVMKNWDGFWSASQFYRDQINAIIPHIEHCKLTQRGIQTSWCLQDCAEYLIEQWLQIEIPVGTTANLNVRKDEGKLITNNSPEFIEETFLPDIYRRINFQWKPQNLLHFL